MSNKSNGKMSNFKRKVQNKYHEAKFWCYMHQDELKLAGYLAGTIGLSVLGVAVKQYQTNSKVKKARDLRDSRIYDPHTGFWYDSKRPLNGKEKIDIENRFSKTGESYGTILRDMGLLKK